MPLFCIGPPYSRLTEATHDADITHLPRGSVLLLSPGEASHARVLLEVQRISSAAPSALLLVTSPRSAVFSGAELQALLRAGAAGLVISQDPPTADPVVRAARRASLSLEGQIPARLRLFGRPVSRGLEAAIEILVKAPPGCGVKAWAEAVGEPPRTLEYHLVEVWHAPAARRLVELVHGLHGVRALQQKPEISVEAALAEAGFLRPQTGRDLVKRLCGARPSEIRQLIGWYWALENWLPIFWPGDVQRAEARLGA